LKPEPWNGSKVFVKVTCSQPKNVGVRAPSCAFVRLPALLQLRLGDALLFWDLFRMRHSEVHDCLAGGGEMGRLMRAYDWSTTPLGPVDRWPQSLKVALRILLGSRYPMFVWWGRQMIMFHNDAYVPILGKRHPEALGKSGPVVWSEIWEDIRPLMEPVLEEGRACWQEERLLIMERNGYPEEAYFTFSYSPIPHDEGGVGGIFCACSEDTQRVLGQRRLRTLRELSARTTGARTVEDACRLACEALADNLYDLPFALIYGLDRDATTAELAATSGLPRPAPVIPPSIVLNDDSVWRLQRVLDSGQPEIITDLEDGFATLACGVWPEPPKSVMVLPIQQSGQDRLAGFLIAGISPRREFDDDYRGFMELLAGHIATALANAQAYEDERRRAEALAELDRAKTAFFSNVSHEFRTPLTLMLGPVEDILADSQQGLPAHQRERLEIAHRNALRLQKLVNTLLDFSRIEAGRVQASYQPTDLATLTSELASNFRSACEKAGLELRVDCPALIEPVYVDRDMWEKVVLNLLSNAFKFTLDGRIEVSQQTTDSHLQLSIRDTGTGIPAAEIPRLFERFHRIEGTRGRTQEGSGIGLALVRELVRLHGGDLSVQSSFGKGSVFTVSIPLGKEHLPADRIEAARSLASTALGAAPFVEEALRWLPEPDIDRGRPRAPRLAGAAGAEENSRPVVRAESGECPHVLLADDNADMRNYVRHLLADGFEVTAVADGEAALSCARRRVPDLIISDVMMPGLDGFALLRELRADPRTREVPVLLLSARAGEEARVEGLLAGADDYLIKPFSAKELLARINSHLDLARLRRDARTALAESEARFRNMADNAPVMIWVTEPSGDCTYLNDRWYKFTGTSPAQALGRGWLSSVHPGDREAAEATFVAANERHEAFQIEYRLRRHDGVYCWAIDSAAPRFGTENEFLGYIGSVLDITDRKLVEVAVRKQSERLRLLWEAAAVLLSAADPDSMLRALFGKVRKQLDVDTYFNFVVDDAGESLRLVSCAGVSDETAQSIHRLQFGQAICGTVAQQRKAVVATRIQESDAPHVQLVKKLGIRAYACHPLLADEGLIGTLSFASHTRDQFDAEEVAFLETLSHYVTIAYERLRLLERLRDADRRKDEFLATLAHELRNPLAPIRNGLQVIRLAENDKAMVDQARQIMERQLEQMVRLIDDLLDISRITRNKLSLQMERVELKHVVQNALETTRPLMEERGHALSIRLPAQPVMLEADPTRLAQVFANLLTNAAKYTEIGGQITLHARCERQQVVVAVRDTGIGIAAEHLPQLFQMFSQIAPALERSQGGLGIGLALVRGLVEKHGGSVEARSEGLGKGSEFIVRVPRIDSESDERSAAAELPLEGVPQEKRRVLVVDDNRDAARMLALNLRLMGHHVQTAHDGQEAVSTAEAFRPDVVLLDIGLPSMNGYEVCRQIRRQPGGERIVMIALTGWGQIEDKRMAVEAGFDHHFTKPVDASDFAPLLLGSRTTS
jgi:PAS domain S-box-containing protein